MPSAQKYLNFNNDPAQNNAAPPVGAPENATNVSALNDIDRYDKASIADLAQDVVTEGIGAQTPDNVAFTGGAITNLTNITADPGYTPTADVNLATKLYVDGAVAGLDVQALIDATIDLLEPVGTVKMWNGLIANIPTYGTWQLCDGTNGTIDLTNVVVKGCDVDGNLGASGGSQAGVTAGTALSEAQLPVVSPGLGSLAVADDTHSHDSVLDTTVVGPPSITVGQPIARQGDIGGDGNYQLSSAAGTPTLGRSTDNIHDHNFTGSLASFGSGQTHDHTITIPEPVHRRIYFIQRTV